MNAINFPWVREQAARMVANPALLALSSQLLARDVKAQNPHIDSKLAQAVVSMARQRARELGVAA
jgi:hypothetical protein